MKLPKNFTFDTNQIDRSGITGKTFERLTCLYPVGYVQEKRKRTMHLFSCSCGNFHIAAARDVISLKTKSCGCLFLEAASEKGKNNAKEKSSNAAFIRYFKQYQSNAKRRGYEFTLEEEDFKKITSSNCHYCGIAPCKEYAKDWKGYSLAYICNGIDRKDNSKGYILSNSLPCCPLCNQSKHTMSYNQFVNLCKNVAENHKYK